MASTSGASCRKFTEFLDQVRAETEELGLGRFEFPWYRGHSSSTHTLLPSLYRASTLAAITPKGAKAARRTDILRLESDLFFEFQMRARPSEVDGQSAWDLLFLMRHYGLPTRTLDWSEILGVAVYFALSGDGPSPTIWVLNPFAMNELRSSWRWRDTVLPKYLGTPWSNPLMRDYDDILGHWKHGELPFRAPVAVCPSRSNERMQAQAGSFTVHGNRWDPIEDQVPKAMLRSITIRPEAIDGARQFLRDAGLTTRVLFPGLEGLSLEMLERFPRSAMRVPGPSSKEGPRR